MLLIKYKFYLSRNNLIYYKDINKRYRLYLPKCFKIKNFKIAYNKNAYLRINKIYL